jgi:hypothetical protein
VSHAGEESSDMRPAGTASDVTMEIKVPAAPAEAPVSRAATRPGQ